MEEIPITSPDPVDIKAIITIVISKYPPPLPNKLNIINGVIYPGNEKQLSYVTRKPVIGGLRPVFAHIFQQSIDTGEVSKEWSLANICPLFKKSDGSLACNYRPVSLTRVPCKLLEHIVCSNIMAHLDE